MPSAFFPSGKDKVVAVEPTNILVFGPFSNRKTTSSATISRLFPPLPAQLPFKEVVELSDIHYNCWDDDALLGFPKLGLSAPHLELSGIKAEDLIKALPDVHQEVATMCARNKTRWIIHDTWSSFDMKLAVKVSSLFDGNAGEAGAKRVAAGDEEGNKNSNQMLFRAMLAVHKQEFEFYTSLKRYDGTKMGNIFLLHAVVKGAPPIKKDSPQYQKAVKELEAKGFDVQGVETGKITIRVTGSAWQMFYDRCPLRLYIHTKEENNAGKMTKLAEFFADGGHSTVSAERGGVLSPVEPADWRVVLPKYLAAGVKK